MSTKQNFIKKMKGTKERLVSQYDVVNKKQWKEIDHHKSPFTMDVQCSKYISIDDCRGRELMVI
jgi:mRNA-degrading endonuclease HigB of HigAB toxin-antitoxin module